ERRRRVRAEHLEIDGRAQPEVGARDGGRAAVAAVPDRRDARREALRRAEAGYVDVRVPADPRLALDVQRDPFCEVAQAVADAAVDGVLDVRVRIDEAREQDGVREMRPRSKL